MSSIFRKVLVSEGLPTVYGEYNTDMGLIEYSPHPGNGWLCYPDPEPDEYWFEPVELPSEVEIRQISMNTANDFESHITSFESGANYILNKLKSETT